MRLTSGVAAACASARLHESPWDKQGRPESGGYRYGHSRWDLRLKVWDAIRELGEVSIEGERGPGCPH